MARKLFSQGFLQHCLVILFIITITVTPVLSQTTALSPPAQEAINKGINAAKTSDYLLAIKYFEEARKIAPQSPQVFFNLGLAESKIPGHEQRAVAWFGAYLNVCPLCEKAEAVNELIVKLNDNINRNLSVLIKSVLNAAIEITNSQKVDDKCRVIKLYLKLGMQDEALKIIELFNDAENKCSAKESFAAGLLEAGDTSAAKKMLEAAYADALLIDSYSRDIWLENIVIAQAAINDVENAYQSGMRMKDARPIFVPLAEALLRTGDTIRATKDLEYASTNMARREKDALNSFTLNDIANAQFKAGDLKGAKKTLETNQKNIGSIKDPGFRVRIISGIAELLMQLGDKTGAEKMLAIVIETAGSIPDESGPDNQLGKNYAWASITDTQVKFDNLEGAQKAMEMIQDTYYRERALKTISDAKQAKSTPVNQSIKTNSVIQLNTWIEILEESNLKNECPLNTILFLDLASYLKSFPAYTNPQFLFEKLYDTAEKLINAKKIVDKILKQQTVN